ncbi:MAG: response regulator [Defluviitaleaceae bacterium]|nr:response regulator [Defluviitaleaceae bacterium]
MAILVFSGILVLSMAAHTCLGAYVLYKCRSRKKTTFLAIILPGFIMFLGFLLEINSVNYSVAFVSRYLLQGGLSFTITILFIFAAEYCDVKIHKVFVVLLLFFATFFSLAVLTNNSHFLYFREISFAADLFLPQTERTHGPIGVASRVYSAVLFCGAASILAYKFIRGSAKIRRRLFLISTGTLISALAFFVHLLIPGGTDFFVGILSASSFVWFSGLGILKNDMFDAISIEYTDTDDFIKLLLDTTPLMMAIWRSSTQLAGCNRQLLDVLGLKSSEEFASRRHEFLPHIQPCGKTSAEMFTAFSGKVFSEGRAKTDRIYLLPDKTEMSVEITGVCIEYEGRRIMVEYMQDMREITASRAKEREAYELQRIIFNSSPYVIALWEGDANIIDVNECAKELYGVNDPLTKTHQLYDFSPPFQPCGTPSPELASYYYNLAAKEGYARFEWMHLSPTGGEMPVECIYKFFELNGRRLMISHVVDLRKIKTAHKDVESAFELTNAILNSAPILISLWDMQGNILRVGNNAVELFGISEPNEIITRFYDFSPEFQPCGTPSKEKIVHLLEFTLKNGSDAFEWLHVKSDGTQVHCEVLSKLVIINNEQMIIVCTRDISRIKEAQKKERESGERMRLMFDAAPLVIKYWNENFELVGCNKKALDFYNTHSPERLNSDAWKNVPIYQPCGGMSKDIWTSFLRKVFNEKTAEITFFEQDLRGNPVCFDIVGVRSKYKGQTIAITYSSDVTITRAAEAERRRAELAEESNLAKSRFLARMSHEIRTPIAAVAGISQIQLRNSDLPPVIEESFTHIYQSANMLHRIINDILDISKIESGNFELRHNKYETLDIISDAVSVCNAYLDNDAVKFNLTVDSFLPVYLVGDVVRISQIINNLLSNAFKFTTHGRVELSLRCVPGCKNEPGYVTLIATISDTGLGMTPEQADGIFVEYTRFHENHGYVQGTGLGMPIVGMLADLMDAEINIRSKVNEGTTVTVKIPQEMFNTEIIGKEAAGVLSAYETCPQLTSKKFNFEPESMPYGKVLVVDDVDANLYVSRGLLEFYDLQTETSPDGFDALEKIKRGNVYDIIFMDQMMPHMDGTETLQRIRALGYNEPIVVLTANALIGQAEKFISEGFDDYLSKPIQTTLLDSILHRYIKNKQPLDVIAATKSQPKPDINDFQNSPEVLGKLRTDFAAEQKNAVSDIRAAIDAGDLKQARLLAHSLKGVAGLIRETELSDVAGSVEETLAGGKVANDTALVLLEHTLAGVLAGIKTTKEKAHQTHLREDMPDSPESGKAGDTKVLATLDALKPMLELRKSESRRALDALRNVPEAALFVRWVEKFDFATALKNIDILRLILEEAGYD